MGEAVEERLVVPEWLKNANTGISPSAGRETFLDKTLQRVYGLKRWLFDDVGELPRGRFFRSISPSARIGGVLLLVIGASLARTRQGLAVTTVFTIFIVPLSGVSLCSLVKRVLPLFIFTLIVALPLLFDISPLRTGRWWSVFFHPGLSADGFETACFFISRSTLMAALVVSLGLTISPSEFMSALRKFPFPALFVTMIFLTLANISRLLGFVEEAILARKARLISGGGVREMEGWFAARARYLLERAMSTSEEVGMAMASRGFDGTLRTLPTSPLRGRDFACIGMSAFVSIMALLI